MKQGRVNRFPLASHGLALAFIMVLAMSVPACGKKGPLYLPDEPDEKSPARSVNTN